MTNTRTIETTRELTDVLDDALLALGALGGGDGDRDGDVDPLSGVGEARGTRYEIEGSSTTKDGLGAMLSAAWPKLLSRVMTPGVTG